MKISPACSVAATVARRPAPRRTGFTLVEMLTVIVILVILMGITLTIQQSIVTKQNVTRAQAELSNIALALEQFKSKYGDYPLAGAPGGGDASSPDAEENLARALTGRARWIRDGSGRMTFESIQMTDPLPDWGFAFINETDYTFGTPSTGSNYNDLVFIDPWGNAYLYRYKGLTDIQTADPTKRTWKTPTFVLLSRGPDSKPEDADNNFVWDEGNEGLLSQSYFDASSNVEMADNIVFNAAQP